MQALNVACMTIEEATSRLRQATTYLAGGFPASVEQAVQTAFLAHATQVRSDGLPYVTHPVAVALILAEWRADAETIAAGLLHDTLEDTQFSLAAIRETFGETIAGLVEG